MPSAMNAQMMATGARSATDRYIRERAAFVYKPEFKGQTYDAEFEEVKKDEWWLKEQPKALLK